TDRVLWIVIVTGSVLAALAGLMLWPGRGGSGRVGRVCGGLGRVDRCRGGDQCAGDERGRGPGPDEPSPPGAGRTPRRMAEFMVPHILRPPEAS
ncbi:hypothetical protein ACWD4N_47035, partial [Streptomyces sp. NPDC002586]